jgi:hypothetical protein
VECGKMKFHEITNLSDILEEGFFSDKVVELLKDRRQLDPDNEKTLSGILVFIEKARSGEKQVNSGKLSSDAIDSIGAYSRAVNMIAYQSIAEGNGEKKALENMLNSIDEEVRTTMKRHIIDPNNLKVTLRFFKFVKDQTLHEASKYYSRKVEVVQWPSLLF